MKSMIFIAALFLMVGCGITIHSDPVKVEGNVTHTVTIDASQLAEFFKAYCESKIENDSSDKVDACVNSEIVLFWQAILNASPNPSPSPSP